MRSEKTKTKWLSSLRAKVLLAYLVGVALSILLIVGTAVAVIDRHDGFPSSATVAQCAKTLAGFIHFDERGTPMGLVDRDEDPATGREEAWVFDSLKQEAAYRVLDASGKLVLSSAAGDTFWPASAAVTELRRGSFEFERGGILMRAATASVVHKGQTWYLQCAVSSRFTQFMYGAFALPVMGKGILIFSFVLLLVFGTCAFVTLKYTLRPLQRISEAAAEISPRSLSARLQTRSVPAEIAPLVESFNRVLDRLEQGYRSQREFLATAAHELKTPLALIRAQVDLGTEGAGRKELLQDVEHMSRQVQQLLHLAEASEVQSRQLVDVDVTVLVEEAASYLARMAQAANVRFDLQKHAVPVHWMADRGALFTLVKNLLENAVQHTPPGTLVSVDITPRSLSVRDWGPGVPQDQLSAIFLRFWRGAHRRDLGAGLGLSICQEIALAHGWMLTAIRADPGLRVVLSRLDA